MYFYFEISTVKRHLFVSTLCLCAIYCNFCEAICPTECLCQWSGKVDCFGVGLQEIPVDYLPANANVLMLGSNFIKLINEDSFQNMQNVREIHLDQNKIQDIPPNSFVQLSELKTLNLRHNKIASLPEEVFAGLNRLNSLDLSGNSISEVHPQAFKTLSQLHVLNLFDNSLRELPEGIFRGLRALKDLNLGKSKLITFESQNVFRGLTNLTVLNLGENTELSSLNDDIFLALPSLNKLILQGCPLQRISSGMFNGLSALQELHLQNTQLRSTIPLQVFENVPNLKTLRIDNNHLISLHESIISPLEQSNGVVHLHLNNWHCSCGLMNMRARWPDVKPQCLHSGIVCQSPSAWNEFDLWSILLGDLQAYCLKEMGNVETLNLPKDSRVELMCPIPQMGSSVLDWITPEGYYISQTTVSLNGEFERDNRYKLIDNATLQVNQADIGSYMCFVTFASGESTGAAFKITTFNDGPSGTPLSPEDSDESNITAFWLPIAAILAVISVIVIVITWVRCRRAKKAHDQPYDSPFFHHPVPVKNVDQAYAYAYVSVPDGNKKKRDISAYAIGALFEFQLPENAKPEDPNSGYDKVKCQRPKSHSCRERGSKYPAPVPLPRPSHTLGSRGASRAESCVYVTPANNGGMGMFMPTRVGQGDSEMVIPVYGGGQTIEIDPELKRLRELHSKSVNEAKRPKSNPYVELIA